MSPNFRRASLLALTTAVAVPLVIGTSMVLAATPSAPIKVTQTYGETVEDGIACGNGAESRAYRRFDINGAYAASKGFTVSSVSVGVAYNAAAPVTGQLKVSAIDHTDPFVLANLEPLATVPVNLKSGPSFSVVTGPITATVPAGKDMVLEVVNPTSAPGEMFLSGTSAAETAEAFLTGCGITEPVTWASVGYPNINLVLHATGKAVDCTEAEAAVTAAEAAVTAAKAAAAAALAAFDKATKKAKKAAKKAKKAKKAYNKAVADFGADSPQAKAAKAKKAKASKKAKKAKKAAKAAKAALVAADAAVTAAQASLTAKTAAAATECTQPALPALPKPAPGAGTGSTQKGSFSTAR